MKRMLFALLILTLIAVSGHAQLTPEQHTRLINSTRWLGSQHISYNESWRPPQASAEWGAMDCSNTVRFIYSAVFGVKLPRTASDQFVALRNSNRFNPAPLKPDGTVDKAALLSQLRSGDLLFWEWTYDVDREPPVSHVMIYLGRKANGTPMMVGSSSGARGEQATHGGVDAYAFEPNAPSGSVKGFFGNVVHRGRFIGFARPILQPVPIETPKKLADNVNFKNGNSAN